MACLVAVHLSPRVAPPRPVAHVASSRRLASSRDAYVHEVRTPDGVRWRFGTAAAEREVRLRNGHLTLVALTDRATGHEYVQGESDVLSFTWNGRGVTGRSASWSLDHVATRRLRQGELLLQLTLHTSEVAVVKHYVLYPGETIVQEWLEVTNHSGSAAQLTEPASLTLQALRREAPDIDFSYLSGASAEQTPSWRFYTTPMTKVVSDTFNGFANYRYGPVQVYHNRATRNGLFIAWDYTGLWRSVVGMTPGEAIHTDFRVRGYTRRLEPGARVETPKVFTGVFHGDLDDMGHQFLDYQYRYKWDYTRAAYFPAVRMLGTWFSGASFETWNRGLDPVSTYRKVFLVADMLRAVGSDVYWRDNGWWDNEGDWNGPDWAETRRYLAQYGMRQTIYMPIYDADPQSQVARAHPEWLSAGSDQWERVHGKRLDQSRPDVIDWELRTLEAKRRQWGDFEWRKDWLATSAPSTSQDSTSQLAQDQGFHRLVQTFLDRNSGTTFHGCAGGGHDLTYELLRLASVWQMTDGDVGPVRSYYASYLFPPDKLEMMPDQFDPDHYEKEWRGLLWAGISMTGETENPEKLEGVRQLVDIYHYLAKVGVVGRWVWVYHPAITGDDAEGYLERLSGDHRRGVIIPGHARTGPVTIHPKGLLPGEWYHVSYQESLSTEFRLGADLMAHGISLTSVPAGELVYLNVPLHPGSPADKTAPTPPSHVTQQMATHMDVSGVEVRWRPGGDDNWVSYYQIYRNGVLLGKVAKGTYYFDHALGADQAARYAVATVDGSGNISARVPAAGVHGPAALVVDDTARALTYTGTHWRHQAGQWSVANGTLASTKTAGDAVSYTFTGSRVTWYGRTGLNNGIAEVYVDGTLDRLVDTYATDETPNVSLYSRAFPEVRTHTIKIVATGVSRDSTPVQWYYGPPLQIDPGWIVLDGVEVDRGPVRVVTPTAPGVLYRGKGWRREQSVSSSRAGDQMTYTFNGAGITWIGRRCSRCGRADVYVDGVLETSVDQYVREVRVGSAPPGDEQRDTPLFTRRWAKQGRHTVRIVVRQDADTWAKGHTTYIDALHVEP